MVTLFLYRDLIIRNHEKTLLQRYKVKEMIGNKIVTPYCTCILHVIMILAIFLIIFLLINVISCLYINLLLSLIILYNTVYHYVYDSNQIHKNIHFLFIYRGVSPLITEGVRPRGVLHIHFMIIQIKYKIVTSVLMLLYLKLYIATVYTEGSETLHRLFSLYLHSSSPVHRTSMNSVLFPRVSGCCHLFEVSCLVFLSNMSYT